MTEFERFNEAMGPDLEANPKIVKQQMQEDARRKEEA